MSARWLTLNPQEISVVELTDGRVYAAARNDANSQGDKCVNNGQDNRAYAISSDGGQTFSKKFAFEPTNRLLFAAPSNCSRRWDLVVSSFDEGTNWQSTSQGTLVWANGGEFPCLSSLTTTRTRLPDGRAQCVEFGVGELYPGRGDIVFHMRDRGRARNRQDRRGTLEQPRQRQL